MIKIVKSPVNGNSSVKCKEKSFGFSNKVTATVKDEHGNITYQEEGYNAITNDDLDTGTTLDNGYVWIMERMFPQGASNYDVTDGASSDADINKMELGTGTAGNGGLGTAISPTTVITIDTANTNLTTVTTGSGDTATTTSVTMTLTGIWDSSFGAFSGVTEVVLMTKTDLNIIAYKALSSLSKATGGSLEIAWAFTIS